jgi:hypothetical protein
VAVGAPPPPAAAAAAGVVGGWIKGGRGPHSSSTGGSREGADSAARQPMEEQERGHATPFLTTLLCARVRIRRQGREPSEEVRRTGPGRPYPPRRGHGCYELGPPGRRVPQGLRCGGAPPSMGGCDAAPALITGAPRLGRGELASGTGSGRCRIEWREEAVKGKNRVARKRSGGVEIRTRCGVRHRRVTRPEGGARPDAVPKHFRRRNDSYSAVRLRRQMQLFFFVCISSPSVFLFLTLGKTSLPRV